MKSVSVFALNFGKKEKRKLPGKTFISLYNRLNGTKFWLVWHKMKIQIPARRPNTPLKK